MAGGAWDLEFGLEISHDQLRSNSPSSVFAQENGGVTQEITQVPILARIMIDRRDNEFVPGKGWFLSGGGSLTPDFFSTGGSWARFEMDGRFFSPLLNNRWLTLGLQGRYAASSPDAPILNRETIGGVMIGRGLPLDRFRTNHVLTARAELRSILIRKLIFGLPLKLGVSAFIEE